MKVASLPITLIVVGAVWLGWHFHLLPDVDWVIALGFMAGGVAVLAIDGVNKDSIVTGPLLIAAGVAWLLHDQFGISWSVLIPAVMVLPGAMASCTPARPCRLHSSRFTRGRRGWSG